MISILVSWYLYRCHCIYTGDMVFIFVPWYFIGATLLILVSWYVYWSHGIYIGAMVFILQQVNKGWNDTKASSRSGSGQGWEQAETYSLFVLLPIQVFAYEYTCSTTRLCILQFTHDRFRAFGQT